jgi:hypothetical protein
MATTRNTAAASRPAETRIFSVNWRLQIDGETFVAGDEVELDVKRAAPLLADGVISAPEGAAQ